MEDFLISEPEPWLQSLLDSTAFPDIAPQPSPEARNSPAPSRRRPRSYRPRNNRSCDFCRKRKSACIVGGGPNCGACVAYGRECTFDRPAKRKRTEAATEDTYRTPPQNATSPQNDSPFGSGPSDRSHGTPESTTVITLRDLTESNDQTHIDQEIAASLGEPEPLDIYPTRAPYLLGDTGESDPYLLRHPCFWDTSDQQKNESKITYKRIRSGAYKPGDHDLGDGRPIMFMLVDHSLVERSEPRTQEEELDRARVNVDEMCPGDVGERLVRLHFRYIYPYFPILSQTQFFSSEAGLAAVIQSLPLSLKASLYASGIPFIDYDDILATKLAHSPPSANELYRIAWLAISNEVHSPHIGTLQACLLLLQRVTEDRFIMDTGLRWCLVAWTVSLAHMLGLSSDCSAWQNIADSEKRLRRRLWWAVYVIDKWSFMTAGLANHIKQEDFDVLPLTLADFLPAEGRAAQRPSDPSRGEPSVLDFPFYHFVELSIILSDIMDTYYTIRATGRTAANFELSLELGKPLRSRLKKWKENYGSRPSPYPLIGTRAGVNLDGRASLGLAYPIATMTLFRALMRPLGHPNVKWDPTARDAVRAGARACCVEIVEYVENLRRGVWDAFWYSFSRANFAIASSFMVRILFTSVTPAEQKEMTDLIVRWKWALRTGGGNAGNIQMRLALLRLDRWLLKVGVRDPEDQA
ncbi:hypothetical protein A1O1_02691 [Capronia coronata CBS 617.96]|uniref:Zn(2)-C6 fungal-type domain-containing protein n=1 Tax=Capronia coronata CBS 617.96 TaxID=1182541 RepID=W9YMZ8_9EURO|nr:uncharacterized protein A1O1_02691 [Capronia coronata CBS 617.96]EXJ94297.1 hypothetical protein A1O1_02691 [Capronia coronata CBS 617.96]